MAPSKRQSDHHDESNRRQGPSDQTVIRAIREIFEPLFREVVQEETQSAVQRCLCPGQRLNQTETCEGRGGALRLHFNKKLPPETFTDSKIVAEDETLLQISLRDAQNHIVRDGPLSSVTIQLFVLKGDFGSNGGGSEYWTAKEFNASILPKTRKGGQLLAGDNKFIKLTNGVGSLNHVYVTDISKWAAPLGKFRLGAKVVESTPEGENIREGVSEAFRVKDKRGAYGISGIRSLKDKKVWRLRKIAKDRKKLEQLRKHEVVTAKDPLHNNDPHLLEQVKGCALHEQDNTGQQSNAGQPYLPIESLDSEHKHVYENLQAGLGLQQLDFPTINQDICVASTSTWHIGEAAHHEQIGINELMRELAEGPLYSDVGEQFFSELQPYLAENSRLLDPSCSPFAFGDGAECSHHSCAVNKSSKGKGKTVWDKIRNALKVVAVCGAIKKAKL